MGHAFTNSWLQTEMASRLARVALLRTRVKPSSTYNVSSIASRRSLHVTSGMMDGHSVLPDEFMEQARKEGEEKEKERKEADREEEIKLELLDASLKQVMRYGWSKEAVRAAAEELGRPSVVAGLVKGGGAELVLHHVAVCNKQLNVWMKEEVVRQKEDGGRIKVGKFVREAVVRRLSMNGEYVRADRWAEALALTAIPPHCEGALKGIQALCDDIWYHAGDISTDYNWYTKRITLAAVYGATEVFMLQDRSPNFEETWAFLDRRLGDLQAAPSLAQVPGDVAAVLGGLATTARNMAGMQN